MKGMIEQNRARLLAALLTYRETLEAERNKVQAQVAKTETFLRSFDITLGRVGEMSDAEIDARLADLEALYAVAEADDHVWNAKRNGLGAWRSQ